MPHCKGCNSEFIVPENTTSLALAGYCWNCVREAVERCGFQGTEAFIRRVAEGLFGAMELKDEGE